MTEHCTSYKQSAPEGPFDVIVIGSGIGSMTAANILSRKGRRVLVLERHYTPGGFTHVFKRKRFEWDVGIHYIGEVSDPNSAMGRMFNYLSGGNLKWADMGDVYDRAVFGDTEYKFVKGVGRFQQQLIDLFPAEEEAIHKYVDLVFKSAKNAGGFFMEKALPKPIGWVAGGLLRNPYLKLADRTTLDVLRELTSNEKLIGVLCTQYGDYGLPPAQSSFAMHAMVVKHYFKGGAFPVGGSSRIFETMAPFVTKSGGVICTNAEVKEILIDNGKAMGVQMADGRQYKADTTISGVGAWNTFARLLSEDQATEQRHAVEKIGPSASHLSLYIGLDKTAAELRLPKANYWLYPSYDHDANVRNFEADPSKPLPLVYISFPSAKDLDFLNRYPGRSTIEIISMAPYRLFEKWKGSSWKKRGDEYEALKKQWTDRLLEHLYKREPQVRGHIEIAELSTPLSTEHFVNYSKGEIYGLAHTPARFRTKCLRPRTNFKNLFLTGQDVVSAGVGGALMGGVLTASTILGKNVMGEMLKV